MGLLRTKSSRKFTSSNPYKILVIKILWLISLVLLINMVILTKKNPKIQDLFVLILPKNLYTYIENLPDPCPDYSPVFLTKKLNIPTRHSKCSLFYSNINWKRVSTNFWTKKIKNNLRFITNTPYNVRI